MRSLARHLSALCLCLVLASRANGLERRTWTVDGVEREALLHIPAGSRSPLPTVFVFHGHGGNAEQAARSFRIHELWPEALVIYPQGLKTPGRLTDPDGKRNGWQHSRGAQRDRDLKFFDAMLKSLRDEGRVDDKRVYVTGHSNGGAFSYLLWAERGDALAAVAASGALDGQSVKQFKPKPAFHAAGRNDRLVKFDWQQRMIDALLTLNQCDREGKKDGANLTTHPSKIEAPVVTYIYDGGHRLPPEVPPAMVAFFKSHPAGTAPATTPTRP
jgi:polyhydroxybutyrate depolymerase